MVRLEELMTNLGAVFGEEEVVRCMDACVDRLEDEVKIRAFGGPRAVMRGRYATRERAAEWEAATARMKMKEEERRKAAAEAAAVAWGARRIGLTQYGAQMQRMSAILTRKEEQRQQMASAAAAAAEEEIKEEDREIERKLTETTKAAAATTKKEGDDEGYTWLGGTGAATARVGVAAKKKKKTSKKKRKKKKKGGDGGDGEATSAAAGAVGEGKKEGEKEEEEEEKEEEEKEEEGDRGARAPEPAAATAAATAVSLYEGQIPKEYMCPISCGIMFAPVIAMDGHSYERAAIEEWIETRLRKGQPITSPFTNQPMARTLIPNLALRNLIRAFCEEQSLPFPTGPAVYCME